MTLQKLLGSTRWRYPQRLESLKNLVLITAAGAARVWRMLAPRPGSQSRKSSVRSRLTQDPTKPSLTKDWQTSSQAELIAHIVQKHHVFTREELERLDALLAKVCGVHGQNHPELFHIQDQFGKLRGELEPHMLKEERVLFPYIVQMEEAAVANQPLPSPPFGTVRNPVRVMMAEHDAAGYILGRMREASSDYAVPADGCISYKTLYSALAALEVDLHQHIHLENNILFPRAAELEDMSCRSDE